MVAVAHQVEHRIVAPEVAGSRPVSHPKPHLLLEWAPSDDALLRDQVRGGISLASKVVGFRV